MDNFNSNDLEAGLGGEGTGPVYANGAHEQPEIIPGSMMNNPGSPLQQSMPLKKNTLQIPGSKQLYLAPVVEDEDGIVKSEQVSLKKGAARFGDNSTMEPHISYRDHSGYGPGYWEKKKSKKKGSGSRFGSGGYHPNAKGSGKGSATQVPKVRPIEIVSAQCTKIGRTALHCLLHAAPQNFVRSSWTPTPGAARRM